MATLAHRIRASNEGNNLNAGFQNTNIPAHRLLPRRWQAFHMRGLQMRLKVRSAFPLFNHHDRVRRQSHRKLTPAA